MTGKHPLKSVSQHKQYLGETLSSPNAIWTLTSLMLPNASESDFKRDTSNPLVEAITKYKLVHVEAYIIYTNATMRNEVTKLRFMYRGRRDPEE
ncbi:hypothetical protein FOXYSP1_19335 [Fusarium oxysporum f. sp. phaseoli]